MSGPGRILAVAIVAAAVTAAGPIPARAYAAPGPAVEVEARIGWGPMVDDAWEPANDLFQYGAGGAFRGRGWPVMIEAGLSRSEARGHVLYAKPLGHTRFEQRLTEAGVGVRWGTAFRWVKPFVGGGLDFLRETRDLIDNDFTGGVDKQHDESLGLYLHGGANFPIARGFQIGVEARGVLGTHAVVGVPEVVPNVSLRLDHRRVSADYYSVGVLMGWAR